MCNDISKNSIGDIMLSKKDRKFLFKAELEEREKKREKQSEEDQYFHIFSDFQYSINKWVKLFKKELKSFNVNLEVNIIDSNTIQINVPDISIQSSCYIKIDNQFQLTQQMLRNYEDKYNEGISEKLIQQDFITLYGKREKNDVINLVFNTSTRILGRITKGILVDVDQEYISNDWLAWSCDYYGNDLFKAFSYERLPELYPCLVAKKRWGFFG